MKSLERQIRLLDEKVLRLFQSAGVTDYSTHIHVPGPDVLDPINQLLPEIRQTFPVKTLNLHKTQYQVISPDQAWCLLKKCLEIACVPFELGQKGGKYVRLIPQNLVLDQYIKRMTSDIRTSQATWLQGKFDAASARTLTGDDLKDRITSRAVRQYELEPGYLYRADGKVEIDLRGYGLRESDLESLSINLVSRTKRIGQSQYPVISQELLAGVLAGSRYQLLVGGMLIHEASWKTELLPGIILPSSQLRYHACSLVIEGLEALRPLGEHFDLVMTAGIVELDIPESVIIKQLIKAGPPPVHFVCMNGMGALDRVETDQNYQGTPRQIGFMRAIELTAGHGASALPDYDVVITTTETASPPLSRAYRSGGTYYLSWPINRMGELVEITVTGDDGLLSFVHLDDLVYPLRSGQVHRLAGLSNWCQLEFSAPTCDTNPFKQLQISCRYIMISDQGFRHRLATQGPSLPIELNELASL